MLLQDLNIGTRKSYLNKVVCAKFKLTLESWRILISRRKRSYLKNSAKSLKNKPGVTIIKKSHTTVAILLSINLG